MIAPENIPADAVTEAVRDPARLAALYGYAILDTEAEQGFDDIVLLAARACGTPVALVSLVAGDRQWFKARVGFDPCQTPLSQSVCANALRQPGLLVIPDLTVDPRTRDNVLVTGEPHLRFYAGARLETTEGTPLGTLCVIDGKPRPAGLMPEQAEALEALARQVMAQMELRRSMVTRDDALLRVREAETRHRQILDSAVDYAMVTMDLDGLVTGWSAGAEAILGWSEAEMCGRSGLIIFTDEDARNGAPEREMGMAREEGRGTDERWHVRKDGSRFFALGEMMKLHAEDGSHVGYLKILRDRTDQHLAAATLQRQTDLLQTVTDHVSEAVFQLDLDGIVTFANRTAHTLLGWDGGTLVGQDLHEAAHHHHPDGRPFPACECGFVEAIREGRTLRQRDATFFHRDGTPVEVVCSNAPVVEDGMVVGAVLTVSDVTGRRLDERRLREMNAELERRVAERHAAEERQRFLLALADTLREQGGPRGRMQVAVDALGRYLGVSRVGYALIENDGVTAVLGTEYVDGVAPLADTYPLDAFGPGNIANLKKGRTSVYADVEADRDTAGLGMGAYGIAAIVAVPQVHEGRLRSVVYVNHHEVRAWTADEVSLIEEVSARIWDAVERVRAQGALRAMNETLAAQVAERTKERDRIWHVSQDMLGVADAGGVWVSINPAWQKILGWEYHDIVGKTSEWLEHPDDRERTRSEVARLAAGGLTLAFENRFRASDGSYRTLSWTAVPVEGLLYCVSRDVTLEKERAATLLQAEEALRQSQKLEAVGQLTGGVAHDFNNLLTVIKSSTDLLKRPDLAEDRRARYIGAISDTVDRAAKLTGQLLAFARRQALRPEVFDAGQSVKAIGEMVGTLTGARIEVVVRIDDEPCLISADPSQFDTALVNMAVNARDAMEGEGRLTIAVEAATTVPAMRSHPALVGDFVRISLSDTGSGIPVDRIDRIFEPFFTTKGVGQGTGLGLSQVFGFAKQSGGEVVVASEVGHGTTFALYLPRADKGIARAEETSPADAAVDGTGTCVLVVEDNREVGTFSTQTLQELGYGTHWVMNADDALAALVKEPGRYDVVFSDVVMPGMNGVELGREVRRLYPGLPVLLTSGYSHILAQESDHGFELLQKPYSVEELSRMLRQAASKRRRHMEATAEVSDRPS
ncbi:PAS domain S-box protein [Methylobacterium sp. WL103]|uniref:PAS domain S-box protein n=1 Tax=Methylobacterium sp. WL103 TaxID=2603891 RepID=UPI0011C75D44|nr:PAS domain S-box protein [Methylobacterium sp. WL103]TXN03743.1 PAS domain S-box protein [Methylobacterium sp. WL103]